MYGIAITLKTEYVLTHTEPELAKITFGTKSAELRNVDKGLYELNRHWLLSRKVDGEVRPFSIVVYKSGDSNEAQREILKIKDHIFLYEGRFYMLGGIPEGGIPKNHLMGSKYICRLTNFPFAHPDQVDAETKNRLKKHRGVPVGEFYGLGSNGFHVRLDGELSKIGLQLAASAYLIYSSI